MKQLYAVQEAHVERLLLALSKNNAALDASDTGCGKTVVAAEIARRLERPLLVICPKAIIRAWERELADRGVKPIGVINYEKLRTGRHGFGKWFNKAWQWDLPKNTVLAWDECQKLQSPRSQNSKMAIAAWKFTNLLLSATAAEDPIDMRALGYLLRLHQLKNWWGWCLMNHCKAGHFGGLEFRGGDAAMAVLHDLVFKNGKGSRISMTDLADHFTECQIITTPLVFDDGEIEVIYKEMANELEELKTAAAEDSLGAQALTAQLRALQQVELCKVPVIIEMAQDLMKEGRSIAIFVNFQATMGALLKKLGTTCCIRGGQTAAERETCLQEFQENRSPVIVANVAAGGVGINLHDTDGRHPRTSVISPSWNAKEIVQVLGRIHRAGGKSATQQHVLFAAGTIEEEIEKAVRKKIKNINALNLGLQEPEIPAIVNLTKMKPATDAVPEEHPHHEFGPSSLKNFEICPSFIGRNGSSELADRGDKIHKALEKGDLETLTPDEKAIGQACLDFVEWRFSQRTGPKAVLNEVRLHISIGELKTFGTCDVLALFGDEAELFDYKTGYWGVPDAKVNPQAQAYALGAMQKFPQLKHVDVFLILPNRQEVSDHRYTREDMGRLELRLSTIITRAMEARAKGDGPFNPQPQLCEYCSNQANCETLHDKVLDILRQKGTDGIPIPKHVGRIDIASPEDIAKILRLVPIVEEWAGQVRSESLRRALEEGLTYPGFDLRTRSTPRTVLTTTGAWDALKAKIGIEQFLAACGKVSVPTLEDDYAEAAPQGEKARWKESIELDLRNAGMLKEQGEVHYLAPSKANKQDKIEK